MENLSTQTTPETRTKLPFSRIGLSFFLFMLIGQGLAAVAFGVCGQFFPQLAEADWFIWAASYAPLYLIAFPIFLLIMRGAPNTAEHRAQKPQGKIGLGKIIVIALACLAVSLGLNLLIMLTSMLIERAGGAPLMNGLAEVASASGVIPTLICMVLVAPIMEEITFRWILYKKLAGYGGKVYVLTSALLFSLFHASFFQIPYAFAIGFVLAVVIWRTGKLRYTIAIHMIVNLLGSMSVVVMKLTEGLEDQMIIEGFSAQDLISSAWGLFLIMLAVLGVILGAVLYSKHRASLRLEPGDLGTPRAGKVLLNTGMILFVILVAGLMVLAQFSGQLAA